MGRNGSGLMEFMILISLIMIIGLLGFIAFMIFVMGRILDEKNK